MSDVKMCDQCGNLFSVNEHGWEQYTRQKDGGNPNTNHGLGYPNMAEPRPGVSYSNPVNHGAATFHTCATCKLGEGPVIRPRVMMAELPSGKVTSDPAEVLAAEIMEDR